MKRSATNIIFLSKGVRVLLFYALYIVTIINIQHIKYVYKLNYTINQILQ